MATTVTPFDSFTCASTGGTWTYIGTLSPAPDAPLTHDGTIDFDGFAAGDYVYQYQAGSSTPSTVTITWSGDGAVRVNDACSGAIPLSPTDVSPFSITFSDDMRGPCDSGKAYPTDSGETEPGSWTAGTYGKDLWYQFRAPVCTSDYNVTVQLDANTTEGLQGLALQVFKACGTEPCSLKEEVAAVAAPLNQDVLSVSILIKSKTDTNVFIRVSGVTAGIYDVNVFSDAVCTPTIANPCTTTTAEDVWGNDPDEVWGGSPDEVWG